RRARLRAAVGLEAPARAQPRRPGACAARRQARALSHQRRRHQAAARVDQHLPTALATSTVTRQDACGGEMIEQLSLEQLTLTVTEEIRRHASMETTFETLLEQIGQYNETPTGEKLPMKIEPWPGGRWFRDLGGDDGHFWGVVQAIKRPTLLEI